VDIGKIKCLKKQLKKNKVERGAPKGSLIVIALAFYFLESGAPQFLQFVAVGGFSVPQ
jgi:hypothetical protein